MARQREWGEVTMVVVLWKSVRAVSGIVGGERLIDQIEM
jgi:hypothetical protein